MALFDALKLASRMPLRFASFYKGTWDFTLYSEGFMSAQSRDLERRMISINNLIRRPVLDPAYVNVAEYVRAEKGGELIAEERITPLELAREMRETGEAALKRLEAVPSAQLRENATLFAEVADVRAWAQLCFYFEYKLRAAVALELFRKTGDAAQGRLAVGHVEASLREWERLCEVTAETHRVVPLAHVFPEPKGEDDRQFHWKLQLPAVRAEVAAVKREVGGDR